MDSLLLSIETATNRCDVAVGSAGRLLARATTDEPRSHARSLTPMIQATVREAGGLDALTAIAVSMGPGSYTGLRIGVSTAKGLAYARNLPILGISTLEAMVHAAPTFAAPGDLLIPILPSRRGEAYLAVFELTPAGTVKPVVDPAALSLDDAASQLDSLQQPRIWMGGPGLPALATHLGGVLPANVVATDDIAPSATGILHLAFARLSENPDAQEDLGAFEPAYLKDFIAKKPKSSIFDRLPF